MGTLATFGKTAIPGYKYTWYNLLVSDKPVTISSTYTTSFSAVGDKIYIVKATKTLNGVNCSLADTFRIHVKRKPKASAGTSQSICAGDNAILGAIPDTGAIYSWKSASGNFISSSANPVVKPIATTKYYLYATLKPVGYGCTFIDSVTITVLPEPGFNAIKLSAKTFSFSAKDTTIVSYLWNFGDGLTDNSANPTHSYSKDSTYKVTLNAKNANGCSGNSDTSLTVKTITAINKTDKPEINVQIYPNPFTNTTSIKYTLTEIAKVKLSIFDITGKEIIKIAESTQLAGTYYNTLDASKTKMPAGVYFVKISINDLQLIKQFIKLQ